MVMKMLALNLVFFILTACQNTSPTTAPRPTLGAEGKAFFDEISARGGEVTTGIGLTQPFFSTPGIVISVSGEDLQVFEYGDADAAARDAAHISPDAATINGESMAWIAPPHFYRHGSLIILYIGDDAATLQLLQELVGGQFAGHDS